MDFIKIRFGDDRSVTDREMQGAVGEGLLRLFDPAYVVHRRTSDTPCQHL